MARANIVSVDELIKHDYVWAVGTAEEINAHNLGWWFMDTYPLVTLTKRLQVRNIEQIAPPREVNEYAEMMKMGDRFPPVIVTRDGFLVDGNTRTEAAKRNKWDSFPAFVVNVNYADLDPQSPQRAALLALGGAQNHKHGRRMSSAELALLIKQISPGSSPKQIQADLHIGKSFATVVWNAWRAETRAAELNIPVTGEMSNSMLRSFGEKTEKYTNPVWGRLFSLAQDAHMSIPQVNEIMFRLKDIGSEDERVALLDAERENYAPAIRSKTRVTPPHARRVKQGLGYLLNPDHTPSILTEKDPVQGPKYLQILMDADEKLRKMIHEQEQVEAARVAP